MQCRSSPTASDLPGASALTVEMAPTIHEIQGVRDGHVPCLQFPNMPARNGNRGHVRKLGLQAIRYLRSQEVARREDAQIAALGFQRFKRSANCSDAHRRGMIDLSRQMPVRHRNSRRLGRRELDFTTADSRSKTWMQTA